MGDEIGFERGGEIDRSEVDRARCVACVVARRAVGDRERHGPGLRRWIVAGVDVRDRPQYGLEGGRAGGAGEGQDAGSRVIAAGDAILRGERKDVLGAREVAGNGHSGADDVGVAGVVVADDHARVDRGGGRGGDRDGRDHGVARPAVDSDRHDHARGRAGAETRRGRRGGGEGAAAQRDRRGTQVAGTAAGDRDDDATAASSVTVPAVAGAVGGAIVTVGTAV